MMLDVLDQRESDSPEMLVTAGYQAQASSGPGSGEMGSSGLQVGKVTAKSALRLHSVV